MVPPNTIRTVVLFGASLLPACGDSNNDFGSNDDPVAADTGEMVSSSSDADQALEPVPAEGGIWRGIDSNGDEWLFMVTPGASMTRIANLTMGHAGEISRDAYAFSEVRGLEGYAYWALPPANDMASYGWSLCIVDAPWNARQPIQGKLACDQMPNGEWVRDIDLAFDPLFDLDVDRLLLVGNWTDAGNPGIDVASFDASGQITGQSSASECVYLGNAVADDSMVNLYHVEWSFSSCSDENAALNGVTFTGLATIDDRNDPVILTVVGTGITRVHPYEENGRGISFTAVFQKY